MTTRQCKAVLHWSISNRMFNPTNLGLSDFSLVATTLDTNNAYKFMSGIEGMDRFNIPDLYKLWVIDLEGLSMEA
jgi:hypothetical protein